LVGTIKGKKNKNKELDLNEKIAEIKTETANQFNNVNNKNQNENIEELIQTLSENVATKNNQENKINEPTKNVIVTEDEQQDAESVADYDFGMSKMNNTHGDKDYRVAYYYLSKAAAKGHMKAREEIAIAQLFGDHVSLNITGARETFEDLSINKASSRAQFYLGFMYATGLGVKSNQAKSLAYFKFSALGNDSFGQMAMAYRYWSSINLEQNCEMALYFYSKVATHIAKRISTNRIGNLVHRIRLDEDEKSSTSSSNQLLLDDDLVQYYQLLADRGDTQAQYGLGLLYYQGGRGIHIQYDKAMHYFKRAAESGNNYAMAYLGKMYLEGDGNGELIKQDNQTAIHYFKMAAEKNNPIGQAGLGTVYLYGHGVEKDFDKALKYFQLSADQGYVEGNFLLGVMFYYGYGVRKDYKMAVKYFNLAAQLGHVLGYFNLAQMHATGTGVLRSCQTATELYKNVAERGPTAQLFTDAYNAFKENNIDSALIKYKFLAELGYEVSQSNAAYLLDQFATKLFNKNDSLKRALVYWNRAAYQGHHTARIKLGDYYFYGRGTKVNYEQAVSHYKYASEISHNPQAMFNLAYMHENGLGLKKDLHLAKRFYDMAFDTSVEAHLPVTLALFKLNLIFYLEKLFKPSLIEILLNTDEFWDVYLMTCIAGLITIVYLLMRQRN